MGIGSNHQMTADVRIEVKNYKGIRAAVQDEILFVVGWVLYGITEDTGIALRHIRSRCRDVGVSPRTPESFHRNLDARD
jgi:hypothetical protein